MLRKYNPQHFCFSLNPRIKIVLHLHIRYVIFCLWDRLSYTMYACRTSWFSIRSPAYSLAVLPRSSQRQKRSVWAEISWQWSKSCVTLTLWSRSGIRQRSCCLYGTAHGKILLYSSIPFYQCSEQLQPAGIVARLADFADGFLRSFIAVLVWKPLPPGVVPAETFKYAPKYFLPLTLR